MRITRSIIQAMCVIAISSQCMAESPDEFHLKFKNRQDFVDWMKAQGRKIEYTGEKWSAFVGAIDGGAFTIDGVPYIECYVFDTQARWANFAEIGDNDRKKRIRNYFNVRCER